MRAECPILSQYEGNTFYDRIIVSKEGVMSGGGLLPSADPFTNHPYAVASVCLHRNTTSSFRVTFSGTIGTSVNSE